MFTNEFHFCLNYEPPDLQIALGTEDVEILRREADCLINYLISENINIMTDYGGIIGMHLVPTKNRHGGYRLALANTTLTRCFICFFSTLFMFVLDRADHMWLHRSTSLANVHLVEKVVLARQGPGPRGT